MQDAANPKLKRLLRSWGRILVSLRMAHRWTRKKCGLLDGRSRVESNVCWVNHSLTHSHLFRRKEKKICEEWMNTIKKKAATTGTNDGESGCFSDRFFVQSALGLDLRTPAAFLFVFPCLFAVVFFVRKTLLNWRANAASSGRDEEGKGLGRLPQK